MAAKQIGEHVLSQQWRGLSVIERLTYTCGHCGDRVGGREGYATTYDGSYDVMRIYICPTCNQPTYVMKRYEQAHQFPGVRWGVDVPGPANLGVNTLYDEARRCMSVSAYTAAVMVCRKLLLNVAHDVSGEKFPNFQKAVNWLVESEYLPGRSKEAFQHIRDVGNEANHEIPLMEQTDAENMIKLSEQLLRLVYQFPNIPAPKGVAPTTDELNSAT